MERVIVNIAGIIAGVGIGQGLLKMFSPQPKWWKKLFIYLLLGMSIAMPSWIGDQNPILIFPFFILGFLLFLPGEKIPKIIIAGIYYSLLIPINMLIDSQYWNDTMGILSTVYKALVCGGLSLLLFRIVPKGGIKLSKKLWLLLGGLTLAPLMSMLSFSIWENPFGTDAEYKLYQSILKRLSYTILPFVMISALALIIAAVVLSRHEALEQENKLTSLREVYYNSLKQEQSQLRILRHDLRNHVTALQGLAEQGKQEKLMQYLAELYDSPAMSGGRRYANNETANVVLCSKVAQMETLKLVPNFEVSIPETLPLSDIDLCALLGNALDNAIEGVEGADNKTITLRSRLEKGMFMLQVQNAIGREINTDLSTTKTNTKQHGYGLVGMREIAMRYGGSLETTAKNGCFELLVCFPCKE